MLNKYYRPSSISKLLDGDTFDDLNLLNVYHGCGDGVSETSHGVDCQSGRWPEL